MIFIQLVGSFFGSSNGNDWISLYSSTDPTCPPEYQTPIQTNSIGCLNIENEFSFKNALPFKYLRFTQYENSYNEPCCIEGWKNTLVTFGIDVRGIYSIDYFECTVPNTAYPLNFAMITYPILFL